MIFIIRYISITCLTANLLFGQITDESLIHNSKQETEKLLAIQVAAKRMLDYMDQFSDPGEKDRVLIVEKLISEMSADIVAHKNPEISKKLCHDLVRNIRQETFNNKLIEEVVELQEHSPLQIKKSDVLSKMGNDWKLRLSKSMDSFLDNQLDELFKAARYRIIILQREEIENSIPYPTFAELDEKLSSLSINSDSDLTLKEFKKLLNWLKSFTDDINFVVVDEVMFFIEFSSTNRLHEIRNQYDRQLSALESITDLSNIPAKLITHAKIEDLITDQLNFYITAEQDKRKQSDPLTAKIPVYPIFSILSNRVEDIAVQLEAQKLNAFITNTLELAIDKSEIYEKISKNPSKYASYDKGLKRLIYSFYKPLVEGIADKYVSLMKAEIDYQPYVLNLLTKKKAIKNTLKQRIAEELSLNLNDVRTEIADQQLLKYYPDYNKPLDYKSIELFYHIGKYHNPNLKLKDVERIKKPIDELYNRKDMLEEAKTKLVSKMNVNLKNGFKSLAYQLRSVDKYESKRFDELKTDVKSEISSIEIYDKWEDSIYIRWMKRAEKTSSPYARLFRATENKIDYSIRQLYDSIELDYINPFLKWRWDDSKRNRKVSEKLDEVDEKKKLVY